MNWSLFNLIGKVYVEFREQVWILEYYRIIFKQRVKKRLFVIIFVLFLEGFKGYKVIMSYNYLLVFIKVFVVGVIFGKIVFLQVLGQVVTFNLGVLKW